MFMLSNHHIQLTRILRFQQDFFGSFLFKVGNRYGSNYVSRRKHIDLTIESKCLQSVLPSIMDEVIEEQLVYHNNYSDLPKLKERYKKLLKHFLEIRDINLAIPLLQIHAYRAFENPSHLTEESLKKSAILGWAIKLADASLTLSDDIFDKSVMRYAKPTWHTLPSVNFEAAICDCSFLLSGGHFLLLNHFHSHPQFANILREYFVNYSTCAVGQCVDTKKYSTVNELEKHYGKSYPITVVYVMCAMYLCNIVDPTIHSVTREFLKDLAIYVQNEDDVNCVYDFNSIRKDCTDVIEGRASWLVIQARKLSTSKQQVVLENHYGKGDKDSLMQIYKLYNELRLKDHFEEYKEDFYESMFERIQGFPKELPKHLFINLLDYSMMGNMQS